MSAANDDLRTRQCTLRRVHLHSVLGDTYAARLTDQPHDGNLIDVIKGELLQWTLVLPPNA